MVDSIIEFAIDEEKIGKMASTDIALGGRIKMPEKGEQITIWLTTSPKYIENPKLPTGSAFVSRAKKYNPDKKNFDEIEADFIWASTTYKTFAAELKRKKMDRSEVAMKNRIITIVGRDWANADKSIWKTNEITGESTSPKTYSLEIRQDLEDTYFRNKSPVNTSNVVPKTNEF